ncbi:hypothetical protein Tco_1279145 [Tanacetum coccineum]
MTESPLMDSGFVVLVFSLRDDLIAYLNKTMAFLTVVASSRFLLTNNQLRTSSNPRNHATIQDGRVIVQQVQGRQGQSYSGTGYKSNATSSGGNNARGQARDKAMLAEAQEAGQILDEEQLVLLADPGVSDDCDDISNAKAVLMANISNYGSDVILEVPHSETSLNDIENQSVQAMQDFEQIQENVQDTHLHAQQDSMILSVIEQMSEQMINHVNNWEKANKEHSNESVTVDLERYKERVKTFEQRLNIDLSSREKMIDSQRDDMIKQKITLKEQVDSLEKNLSKQIKEKECLLQTFTVFKSESKEKEDKYMENEIDLEKKIKELDNILFKVGQSAQTVHIKPSDALPVKIEAPKELPKISLVNESLKKLKFHLAKFDNVVKIRTTPNGRTEGEWGFEHTKDVFNNEIIPFLKSLKDIFNVFDRDLLNEIIEV